MLLAYVLDPLSANSLPVTRNLYDRVTNKKARVFTTTESSTTFFEYKYYVERKVYFMKKEMFLKC